MTGRGFYAERQNRATQLLEAFPHAAEMLGLYCRVLARQEPLYLWALDAANRGEFEPEEAPEPPRLGCDRLPFGELAGSFRAFVAELGEIVPKPLAATGAAIAAASDEVPGDLLRRTVTQDSLASVATSLGCEVPHLAFYSRAFLQPLAEALSARDPRPVDGGVGLCPRCGWPPQVSVLHDEPEIKGRRHLICGLCATWWPFTRSVCPNCGENDPTKLPIHEAEGRPALRVEECSTCKGYLKSVDLRRDGHAVPVVEDVASIELDLWSEDRGLWKLSRNLLGM